ncbi:MAG: hypothetical protein PVG27_12605 [Chloroflexota bacterium]|jgi:hypothetical protein
MRILRWSLAGILAVALLPVSGVEATATNGQLYHCFETPGVQPMNANRPGYTYRSFSLLNSGCSACDQACDDAGDRCIAWSCFHPTFFGSIEGVQKRPILCHLKSELPIPSPDPCGPPPRAPTSGNRVHDDRCYTSSQAPMTLPPRPERERGVQSTISIADPAFNANVAGELLAEAGLLNQILADPPPRELPQSISVLPQCSRVLGLPWPPVVPGAGATLGIGPGLVTGPDARAAFDGLRADGLVAFTDFENVPTGLHRKLTLDGPDGDVTIRLRTTEIRYPLPVRKARKNTPVAVLPYDFVSAPDNHRLMGVQATKLPDGQSRYELVLSPPMSHVGLLRMWSTDSLTRFYNRAGTLLAEHRNTTNHEFVGYVADRPENRVARIEFDGVRSDPKSKSNKLYQVGEVDDLYLASLDTADAHAGTP